MISYFINGLISYLFGWKFVFYITGRNIFSIGQQINKNHAWTGTANLLICSSARYPNFGL